MNGVRSTFWHYFHWCSTLQILVRRAFKPSTLLSWKLTTRVGDLISWRLVNQCPNEHQQLFWSPHSEGTGKCVSWTHQFKIQLMMMKVLTRWLNLRLIVTVQCHWIKMTCSLTLWGWCPRHELHHLLRECHCSQSSFTSLNDMYTSQRFSPTTTTYLSCHLAVCFRAQHDDK